MKIIHERPAKEFAEKYKTFLPDNAVVSEVRVYEYHWYQWKWWPLKWWQFVMWLCTRIIEEPKDGNKITFE